MHHCYADAVSSVFDDMFPPDSWESVNPRFLEAVRLWHAVPAAMLVMSGGPGSSANSMESLAVRFGIPKEAMILETSGRNKQQQPIYGIVEVQDFEPLREIVELI